MQNDQFLADLEREVKFVQSKLDSSHLSLVYISREKEKSCSDTPHLHMWPAISVQRPSHIPARRREYQESDFPREMTLSQMEDVLVALGEIIARVEGGLS
jgi:hypothetical protein